MASTRRIASEMPARQISCCILYSDKMNKYGPQAPFSFTLPGLPGQNAVVVLNLGIFTPQPNHSGFSAYSKKGVSSDSLMLCKNSLARYCSCVQGMHAPPVVLSEQISPGSFEFALDHLVEHELDLSELDARRCTRSGACTAWCTTSRRWLARGTGAEKEAHAANPRRAGWS